MEKTTRKGGALKGAKKRSFGIITQRNVFYLPKGVGEALREHAQATVQSTSMLAETALREYLERQGVVVTEYAWHVTLVKIDGNE